MRIKAPRTTRRLPPLLAGFLAAGFLAMAGSPAFAQTYTFTQVNPPGKSKFIEGRAINDKGQIVGDVITTDAKGAQTVAGFFYPTAKGKVVTFVDPNGINNTQATGVNTSGRIVGTYVDTSNAYHGYIYENGLFTPVDPFGSTFTLVWGVNGDGDVVGSFTDPQTTPSGHGFLYAPPAFETIDDPLTGVYGYTAAFGVNNLGDVTGLYGDGSLAHGFVKIGETYTTLDPAGSTETHALGINTSDQVAGFYSDSLGRVHGFLYQPVIGYTVIDPPGSTFTTATGINNAGQVVGYYTDASGLYHGFVYTPTAGGGTYASVDPPGATGTFTLANGINNSGQVVGEFTDGHQITHAFIATPNP